MRIQKTFHILLPIAQAQAGLANIHSYRRYLEGVTHASMTADGEARIDFDAGNGFNASLDVREVPADEPDMVLFGSTGGDMEMVGVLEFFAVKENLTEMTLTLDYTIQSRLYSAIDFLTSFMDRFVNRQISVIQAHFQGVAVPMGSHESAGQPVSELEYAPIRVS